MSRSVVTITPNPAGTTSPLELPKRGRPGLLGNDAMLLELLQRIANRLAAIDADLTTETGTLSGAIATLQGETSTLDGRLDTIEGQNLNGRVTTLENTNTLIARVNIFGMGSDGNVSLNGSVAAPSWATKSGSKYILNRDVYCNSLTLTGTAQLVLNGFRLFVLGTLDIQNAAARAISADGVDYATPPTLRTVGLGGAGGLGGAEATGGEQPESASGYQQGGAGGRGAGASGFAGGAVSRSASFPNPSHNLTLRGQLMAGGGGGGGGQTNASAGAGGNGGGVVAVWAYTIARGASTPAAVFSAQGQAGANAAVYGGGGGGGGWVHIVYGILAGTAVNNAINVSGGAAGTGGTLQTAGGNGRISLLNVTTGVFAETLGTAQANL